MDVFRKRLCSCRKRESYSLGQHFEHLNIILLISCKPVTVLTIIMTNEFSCAKAYAYVNNQVQLMLLKQHNLQLTFLEQHKLQLMLLKQHKLQLMLLKQHNLQLMLLKQHNLQLMFLRQHRLQLNLVSVRC